MQGIFGVMKIRILRKFQHFNCSKTFSTLSPNYETQFLDDFFLEKLLRKLSSTHAILTVI